MSTHDYSRLGPLAELMKNPRVTEVMVMGANDVYVEVDGKILVTPVRFKSEEELMAVIRHIVEAVGRRVDAASPLADARLSDGSRVHVAIRPVAVDGPLLNIRKFVRGPLNMEDLIRLGSCSETVFGFVKACVLARANIVISGGTGSGKTTLLNVLSGYLPDDERIVTIEDSAELRLQQPHVVRLESRPPNIEGRGEVTIRDLVRNSLRMRPDRIVVGEVRGGEALDMMQAMNTGHDGSISTVHSNSPRDALSRVETMMLMAGMDIGIQAIREQVSSALNLIVHQTRMKDGVRRITHVTEVAGMEGDIITLQDLFLFDYSAGIDDEGRFRGKLQATGIRPRFVERLADLGVPVPADVFTPGGGRNT
jgi:pilus assembly protein CpaF